MKRTKLRARKGNPRATASTNVSKKSSDRRTQGERRSAADKRREHDRFSTAKKSNDRRQNERRNGRN